MRGRFDIGDTTDVTAWHGVLVNRGDAEVHLLERFAWDAAHMRRPTQVGDVRLGHVSGSIWKSTEPDVLVALGGSRRRRRVTILAPAAMKELAILFWALDGTDDVAKARCLRNWCGLHPTERRWLFLMARPNGRVMHHGWYRAIQVALRENPTTEGTP